MSTVDGKNALDVDVFDESEMATLAQRFFAATDAVAEVIMADLAKRPDSDVEAFKRAAAEYARQPRPAREFVQFFEPAFDADIARLRAPATSSGSLAGNIESERAEDEREEVKDEETAEPSRAQELDPRQKLEAAFALIGRFEMIIVPRNILSRPASIRGIVTRNMRVASDPKYPKVLTLFFQFANEAKRHAMSGESAPSEDLIRLLMELSEAFHEINLAY